MNVTNLHVTDIIHTWFVQMPDCIMWQSHHRELHAFRHLLRVSLGRRLKDRESNLSKAFSFRMFLKTECVKVDPGSEHLGLCQYANTSHTINVHFHIRVPVWIP